MTATLDEMLAAVTTLSKRVDRINSKINLLLQEAGIIMSMQDDISSATETILNEVSTLNTVHDQLSALIDQLRNQSVDPATISQFENALSSLKPSVDNLAALVPSSPDQPPA